MRIRTQEIIADSEGAGRFRGTPGAYCEYGPVDTELVIHYASDGTINPPAGVRGGLAGSPADQYRRLASGALEPIPPVGSAELASDETIVSISCGGGGYGPPMEREPERVAHDVSEGWVTRERAAEIYGVVVGEDGTIESPGR